MLSLDVLQVEFLTLSQSHGLHCSEFDNHLLSGLTLDSGEEGVLEAGVSMDQFCFLARTEPVLSE